MAGGCGQILQFPATAAVAGVTQPNPPGTLYFNPCDGSSGPYQLDIAAWTPTTESLTICPRRPPERLYPARPGLRLNRSDRRAVDRRAADRADFDVRNSERRRHYQRDCTRGGLISIYGTGLATSGAATSVQVNGESATVVASYPFQVNAEIPFDITPSQATLSVNSGNGAAQQTVTVSAVAPAIFSLASGQAAITNQDNSLNTASNPALRGRAVVIYCTGLGAVSPAGSLSAANTPVSVVIGGGQLATTFAGLTPGATGLYQVNVLIPSSLPPGLALPLYLKQGAAVSNTVTVAIQ